MKKKDQKLELDPEVIRKTKLYTLHQATKGGEKLYAKVFYNKYIQQMNLEETLQFNEEALTTEDYDYPEHILDIKKSIAHSQGVIFLTEPYEMRLSDYIDRKVKIEEKESLEIFSQIIKAIYSIMAKGYWHRSIRAEHFVKVGYKWKLESLVFSQTVNELGESSEYLWSSSHQPPEGYKKNSWSEEDLDEKMVWDLGCILIHMLLGNHKLKNEKILDKFKQSAFSFQRLGAKAASNFHGEMKKYLGEMCHYNQEKRMKIQELLSLKYFCEEVAAKIKPPKESKIFIGGSGSVSQALIAKKPLEDNELQKKVQDMKKVHAKEVEKSKAFVYGTASQLNEEEGFHQKLSQIHYQGKNLKGKKDIPNVTMSKIEGDSQNIKIVNMYKRFIDKCSMLRICDDKFVKMSELFNNKDKAKVLVGLTSYAINFVSTLEIYTLAKYMNNNQDYFDCNEEDYEIFHQSREYESLKALINAEKDIGLQRIKQIKEAMKTWQAPNLITEEDLIKVFVNKNVESCKFQDIKYSYRRILKIAYDLVTDHYSETKDHEWARIGVYLTYCMAIDKLYIPQDFQDNFKHYFEFQNAQKSDYIPLNKFQLYIEAAPKNTLVQNSRYIIQKYFVT